MGFHVDARARKVILAVFIVYSLVIVGLGIYVQLMSKRKSNNQKLADYLTGSGGLGPIALGMLIFTNLMSSGGMIGGPGLGYSIGYIWSIAVYGSFVVTFYSLISVGKKMNIMAKRTDAQTVVQLMRHRYESKAFGLLLGAVFIIFLLPYSASQFSGGAKLLSAIIGADNYRLGVFIFAVITLIYTLSGGISSLARVAVFQGGVMLASVVFLYVGTLRGLSVKFGSVAQAMDFVIANRPELVSANTWTLGIFIGNVILMTMACGALPSGLITTFTYKDTQTMRRGAIVGVICYTVIQFTMSGLGPLGYAVQPNLTSGDFVTPMLVVKTLPPFLGGFVIAGAAAAIQSTVAAFLIIISSTIIQDIYHGIINPRANVSTLQRGNKLFTGIAAVIAIVIALFPNNYIQLIVNFAIGGIASGFICPLMFGLYSKRATGASAVLGLVFGMGGFIFGTLAKAHPIAGLIHPVIWGIGLNLIVTLITMSCTKRVKLGTLLVWFGEDYDEFYAKLQD